MLPGTWSKGGSVPLALAPWAPHHEAECACEGLKQGPLQCEASVRDLLLGVRTALSVSAPALASPFTDGLGQTLGVLQLPANGPLYTSPVKWGTQSSHGSDEDAVL